jgi:hypothetical protein
MRDDEEVRIMDQIMACFVGNLKKAPHHNPLSAEPRRGDRNAGTRFTTHFARPMLLFKSQVVRNSVLPRPIESRFQTQQLM